MASPSAIRVTAYAPSGDVRRTDDEIADFPADTTQIGVELLAGSEVVVAGKTAPLGFNDLADGAQIPIAMAPLGGFCQLRGMAIARSHPAVARAGDGVLIVGGDQPDPDNGRIASTAEYFDPATATFFQLEVPSVIGPDYIAHAFPNASLATLPDGRVVVTGDVALTTFDPATRSFSEPGLVGARDQHGSVATDATHVWVAGGCALTGSGAHCDEMSNGLISTLAYGVDAQGKVAGDPIAGPQLPMFTKAIAATLYDIGVISDGTRRLTLAGGSFDAATMAFQIPVPAGDLTVVPNMYAQVAQLDGGALLNAFYPDGNGSGDPAPAGILPPEGSGNADVARAPNLSGARLIGLEDGTAVAIGGQDQITRFDPTTSVWASGPSENVPAGLTAPVLVRLADGSVLVLPGDQPSTNAWLYRPSLVGPNEGNAVTALPDGSGAVLTMPSPQTVTRVGRSITLNGDHTLTARALVGGPRRANGTLAASVTVTSGGVALIARQTAPAHLLAAVLVPGQPARIERHDGASVTTLCEGAVVGDLSAQLSLSVGDSVTASVGGTALVSCADAVAPEPGAWGIASTTGTGGDANGSLGVVTVTVGK